MHLATNTPGDMNPTLGAQALRQLRVLKKRGFRPVPSLVGGLVVVFLFAGWFHEPDPAWLLAMVILLSLYCSTAGRMPSGRGTAPTRTGESSRSQAIAAANAAALRESQSHLLAKLHQLEAHRTDYVAMLSHELRTPLTSMKGFAQLILRHDAMEPETLRLYVARIAAEAEKLNLVVDDIIELTRMESGLLELRSESLCPKRLITQVVEHLRPAVTPQKLQVSLPDLLPAIHGDRERLQQALMGLVVDAVGRSSPGTTVLMCAEASGEGVTISIEYDTTDDMIAELDRALAGLTLNQDDAQQRGLGRRGLGLYILRNFIEAHGGEVWVERPGGSRVRIALVLTY